LSYCSDVARRVVLQRALDVALAAGLAGMAVAEVWVPLPSVVGEGSPLVTTVVAVLTCGALAFRRVRPFATALVVLLAWPVVFAVTPVLVLFWGQLMPIVVALYTVARYGSGRQDVYGAAAGAATLLYLDLFVAELRQPGEIFFHWTVCIIAWSTGRGLRAMEHRAHAATRRAVEVEQSSRERTLAAVADERARIARELHDVVAHAVTVMVVQAGAAEQVVQDDPERARTALQTIRGTGTEALAEMRRVVAMLREQDETGEYRPQPGLAALPALLEDARSAGLDAVLTVDGEVRDLPAGLDLSAYRIVQEALTNVRRHSGASAVWVQVRYGPDRLEVEVSDDGYGVVPDGVPEGGHGLIGMRERAALYGGHLETAAVDGGGFAVRAVLPVAAP